MSASSLRILTLSRGLLAISARSTLSLSWTPAHHYTAETAPKRRFVRLEKCSGATKGTSTRHHVRGVHVKKGPSWGARELTGESQGLSMRRFPGPFALSPCFDGAAIRRFTTHLAPRGLARVTLPTETEKPSRSLQMLSIPSPLDRNRAHRKLQFPRRVEPFLSDRLSLSTTTL